MPEAVSDKGKSSLRFGADPSTVRRIPPIAVPETKTMRVADRLRSKLQAAFAPTRLAVTDDSARHKGHAGARPEGETHFTVEIVSAAFAGMSRVERQRRIYAVLAEELAGPVHALSLSARAPGEEDDA
jgi:BolA protein